MQNRFLSMQVQDLESIENKLRNELARISTVNTMSQLLGETSGINELVEDADEFQFVNSMGLSAKQKEEEVQQAEKQELKIQNRFSKAPEETIIQDHDFFDSSLQQSNTDSSTHNTKSLELVGRAKSNSEA